MSVVGWLEANEMPVERGDRAVLAMAGRQHAVVTSAQLRDAGLGRNAVAHRIAHGVAAAPLIAGVYLVVVRWRRAQPARWRPCSPSGQERR